MASRRFCDMCDAQLTPEDDQPFIRELNYIPVGPDGDHVWPKGEPEPKAVAAIVITNEQNHPLTDICLGCKLKVVTDGQTPTKPAGIATLQPNVASDTKAPVTLFRLPKDPPMAPRRPPAHQPPIINIEPSMPVHHDQ
jgi:hypothetical protein